MQEYSLVGRSSGLRIFWVPEFGTRASFRLDRGGQCSIICCVAEDVAREFVTYYREGDMVAVLGNYEPRPSTASPETPWVGRFRAHGLLQAGRVAA
jgi:hypothetical protein